MSVHFSSKSDDWATPPEILLSVKSVFGQIDLDPCSNLEKTVDANYHFTIEDDGLKQEWFGKVYMNPPYGRVIVDWIDKLKSSYEDGKVTEAIALVPARTDTRWFRKLSEYPRCFIDGRLKFGGHDNSAPFPCCAIYLGNNIDNFADVFSKHGDIYALYKSRLSCIICDRPMVRNRKTKKYCSSACRQKAFRNAIVQHGV